MEFYFAFVIGTESISQAGLLIKSAWSSKTFPRVPKNTNGERS